MKCYKPKRKKCIIDTPDTMDESNKQHIKQKVSSQNKYTRYDILFKKRNFRNRKIIYGVRGKDSSILSELIVTEKDHKGNSLVLRLSHFRILVVAT